jgi:hypothetical protein
VDPALDARCNRALAYAHRSQERDVVSKSFPIEDSGLGLGAVLTTLHMPYEREIKELLGVPAHVDTAALVPVGHPKRKHGPPRRIPAAERTHRERWENI